MNEKQTACIVSLFMLASLAASAASRIEDARIVSRPLAGELGPTIDRLAREAGERSWVAYGVPMLPGDHELCCHDRRDGPCRLDDDSWSVSSDDETVGDDRELRVLVRLEDGRVRGIRAFEGSCPLDARGATVWALDPVAAEASAAYLEEIVRDGTDDDVREDAIAVLSFHAGARAREALFALSEPETPEGVRGKAAFWLGVTRGASSLDRLGEMAREDPSEEVRAQAVFAISAGDAPGSETLLVDLARRDPRPATRSTALFWLGQEAGERVVESLRGAVEQDPDAKVREQAVFALSQLPAERGVPLLLDVARSPGHHPDVRRAAIFWLGQSGDPRALDFFEELLAGGEEVH